MSSHLKGTRAIPKPTSDLLVKKIQNIEQNFIIQNSYIHNCITSPQLPSTFRTSGVPRNFFRGGGSTNSVEDRGKRGRGSGGSSPLVRGSGGSRNLVQEISFHIVTFS